MAARKRPLVIALEEHYWDADVAKTFGAGEARDPELRRRLDDLGALRLKGMDEAGIDVHGVSHRAPPTQRPQVARGGAPPERPQDPLPAARAGAPGTAPRI